MPAANSTATATHGAKKIDDALWQQVTNDRHGCLKSACPNRAECPFYLARDTLEHTDVIVANHDLLLADISMGGGVILPAPENSFYCIDEAHHLPKKALNQFAAEHTWLHAMWTAENCTAYAKIALLTDKLELANLANEAATSLLDSLNEWQFHLMDAPELATSEQDHENHLAVARRHHPPELENLVHNTKHRRPSPCQQR